MNDKEKRAKIGGGSRRRVRTFGAFFCVLWMVLGASALLAPAEPDPLADVEGDYAPGELLIKFTEKASDDDVKDAKKALDARELKTFKGLGISHWKLGEDCDVEKALKEFEKDKYDDIVDFAEPNYYCRANGFPTDPMRGEQWSMHNAGQTGTTNDADIDMLEFWDSPTGSTEVVVAVLDSGVDYTHPDLDGAMWKNPGETGTDGNGKDKATNGIDDDGNGFKDDVYGYDFYNNDGDPMDDYGHGTHCAGIIAAERDNGVGIAGVSAKVKIMALKFLSSYGSGTNDGAIAAVNYAASFTSGGSKVVKITSNSWGNSLVKSKAMETAIKNSGALFVASAGTRASSDPEYPAAYTLDNIISVTATDGNDALAGPYSTTWVDLGAPGVNVYSCYLAGNYRCMSGTSEAAPHVAGAAALVWSKDSGNTIAQVKAKIMDNVESESSLQGKTVSGGKLNIQKMFGSSSLPSDSDGPETVSDLAVETGSETTNGLTLTWTAIAEDSATGTGTAYAYDVRYLNGEITGNFDWAGAIAASAEPNPGAPDGTESFTVAGLNPDTTYTFALKVVDEAGNMGGLSSLVSGTTSKPKWDIDGPIQSGSVYQGFALDGNGNPALAYKGSSGLEWAVHSSDGSWSKETVDSGSPTYTSLAWDGGTWVISYTVPGKLNDALKFARRTGANSWSKTTLETTKIAYNVHDIAAFNDGSSYRVGISYCKGGLIYAEYDGSSWTKTTVDTAAARYSAIEFDSSGQPHIAYCDLTGTNGNQVDVQKYAKRSSSGSWSTETVATGVVGFGIFPDLDLAGDVPYIVSSFNGVHFYTPKSGGGWTRVDWGSAEAFAAIAVDDSGSTAVPYVAYPNSVPVGINVAKGEQTSGVWTFTSECADIGMINLNYCPCNIEFYYHSGDTTVKRLDIGYSAFYPTPNEVPRPRENGPTLAERDLLDPSTWG